LEAGKQATNGNERAQDLQRAEEALNRARAINPYNTDHSANLARLAQARGALGTDLGARIESYKQSATFFQHALHLSPNTAHLYVQFAQSLMEYSQMLDENNDAAGAAAQRELATQQIQTALEIDSTFCFTFAVRAQTRESWRERTTDALDAVRYAPRCGDVFYGEGLSIAVNELARASDEALEASEGTAFEQMVEAAAQANPTLEVYTTLANFYSKAGRIPEAITAIDQALEQIPATDTATSQRYKDFRFTLVELQSALNAAAATPNDPELQRALAQQWLVRGQFNFALPVLQRVAELKPDDYNARRNIALVLIATDQLDEALPQVGRAQELAPNEEKDFWQKLGSVVQNISSGNEDEAVAQLDELARAADTNDYALVSALRKLAERLKGAG
jgi:tetratricopeptide (TPR) repeat protein